MGPEARSRLASVLLCGSRGGCLDFSLSSAMAEPNEEQDSKRQRTGVEARLLVTSRGPVHSADLEEFTIATALSLEEKRLEMPATSYRSGNNTNVRAVIVGARVDERDMDEHGVLLWNQSLVGQMVLGKPVVVLKGE